MPIRAVLWDVDDTLFDHSGADRAGVLSHLRAEGLIASEEEGEAALERWRTVMEEQYARFVAGELEYHEHRRARARLFLDTPLSDDEADAWFSRYVAHYEAAWTLFPDVLPALRALTPGYRHGVLSNSYAAGQERKLRTLGVREHFETLLCSAELGCAKPAPEAFALACAALDLPPEQVAYVGDRHDLDARGADAAGLYGIWLDRVGTVVGAEVEGLRRVTTLAALPTLLSAADRAEADRAGADRSEDGRAATDRSERG